MVGCHASRQVAVLFALHSSNINKVPEGRKINHSIDSLYFSPEDETDGTEREAMYLAETTPPAAPADTSYETRVLSSTL